MEITVKDATATIAPAEDDEDAGPGSFDVVLSAPTKDRDGETIKPSEWEALPEHIGFDVDHGLSVASVVGSGRPFIDGSGNLRTRGTYSSIPRAQEVRTLVREGHVRTVSVSFLRKRGADDEGNPVVRRELLNGSFVSVPANPDAVVLTSKAAELAAKVGRRNRATDQELIQAMHDHAAELGASCAGADGGKSLDRKASVSDKPWSDFSASDYTIEQWRRACLIGPDSPSDNKADYSLPVREPDGTLNRSACHAAASVLAGGRGGVHGSDAQKRAAARKLASLYRSQLGEHPPESLARMAGKSAARKQADTEDAGDDPGALAAATDAALDEAIDLLSSVDTTELPGEVQQALALLQAAGASVDELLDALGIPDPDEDNTATAGADAAEAASASAAVAVRAARIRALSAVA